VASSSRPRRGHAWPSCVHIGTLPYAWPLVATYVRNIQGRGASRQGRGGRRAVGHLGALCGLRVRNLCSARGKAQKSKASRLPLQIHRVTLDPYGELLGDPCSRGRRPRCLGGLVRRLFFKPRAQPFRLRSRSRAGRGTNPATSDTGQVKHGAEGPRRPTLDLILRNALRDRVPPCWIEITSDRATLEQSAIVGRSFGWDQIRVY
jgi:hypothetical protein